MLKQYLHYTILLSVILILMTACSGTGTSGEPAAAPESQSAASEAETAETMEGEEHDDHDEEDEHEHDAAAEMLDLPALAAVDLGGRPLRVVATTSLIGDVVANIGGEMIELTTLMGPGVDPHSYEPSAGDFTKIADADVIFINGWDLEEGLVDDLETAAEGTPVVIISAGIEPLAFGEGGHDEEAHEDEEHEGEAHEHSGADPHVWFSVHNVEQWSKNVEAVLHKLDPAHDETYEANLDSYLAQLEELEGYIDEQLEQIPTEERKLVTNHDAFGYLAAEYEFEVIGTVIPSASTLAEPSARDLADLIEEMNEEGICTIFTENTVSDQLASTVAAELANCENVQVLPLFTGALGPAGSGVESYIEFMRINIETITKGLGG